MVAKFFLKRSTVAVTFRELCRLAEAKIVQIEKEAIAAARTLGFEVSSKGELMTALDREISIWERQHGQGHAYLSHHAERLPPEADRIVCVTMISWLIDVREDIEPNFMDRAVHDAIDKRLTVLRRRLPSACRQRLSVA